MLNEKVIENFVFQNNSLELLCNYEYVNGVLVFGSFLSILHDKRINPSILFNSILENLELRELFIEITGSKNTKQALLDLLHLYPALIKSKNTKKLFKKSIKK
jgi:hypothetical protein